MTKERHFKKEYADELLRIARSDLESAEVLAKGAIKRKENILFHVGQAIEKALKAKLCAKGEPVPLTHDLAVIIDRFSVTDKLPHSDELDDLSQFATIRRYEEGAAILTAEEISTALVIGKNILDWAEKK